MAERERDEGLVGELTRIHDACRKDGVDERPVAGPIEDVVRAVRSLRDAENAAGLNRHQRTVIGSAIGDVTKAVQLQ